MMKKFLKRAGIFLIILAVLGTGVFLWVKNETKTQLGSMDYENIDITQVLDGSYYGDTDAGLVFVKVEVTVKGHKIKKIDILEHRNGMGSAAESITQTMIEQNSYDVDAVSGATISSEAIKSAVSKALKAGLVQ